MRAHVFHKIQTQSPIKGKEMKMRDEIYKKKKKKKKKKNVLKK